MRLQARRLHKEQSRFSYGHLKMFCAQSLSIDRTLQKNWTDRTKRWLRQQWQVGVSLVSNMSSTNVQEAKEGEQQPLVELAAVLLLRRGSCSHRAWLRRGGRLNSRRGRSRRGLWLRGRCRHRCWLRWSLFWLRLLRCGGLGRGRCWHGRWPGGRDA